MGGSLKSEVTCPICSCVLCYQPSHNYCEFVALVELCEIAKIVMTIKLKLNTNLYSAIKSEDSEALQMTF